MKLQNHAQVNLSYFPLQTPSSPCRYKLGTMLGAPKFSLGSQNKAEECTSFYLAA